MKTNALALLLLMGPLSAAAGVTPPRLTPAKGHVAQVELGPDVTRALETLEPEFKMFKSEDFIATVREMFAEDTPEQTPMAVVGDFNGDQTPDVVVMGAARKERLIIAVISGPKGYVAKVVTRDQLVSPEKSLFPPMVDDATVSDEHEGSVPRERGLYTYLTLVPALKRAPKDGAKHFKDDAILIETFQSNSAPLMRLVNGTFREWRPGQR